MMLRLSALLVLLAFGLVGCTTPRTPAERIERDRAAYSSWPADVQQKVSAGQAAVGFDEAQVRMALGEPDDISTRTTADGQSEVWAYRDKSPRVGFGFGVSGGSGGSGVGVGVGTSTGGTRAVRLRVVFTDGRVSAIEQAR
ncbi:MAG TPA: hypothetical protein VHF69_04175 [Candidatus Synoicihabitans sp.]|nr:hypothetical protein [Candidatus Synoicihabitans sp.]